MKKFKYIKRLGKSPKNFIYSKWLQEPISKKLRPTVMCMNRFSRRDAYGKWLIHNVVWRIVYSFI